MLYSIVVVVVPGGRRSKWYEFVTGEEALSVPGKQRETWPLEFRHIDKIFGKQVHCPHTLTKN